MHANKYQPIPSLEFNRRSWPSKTITTAPRWCSLVLREGNRALVEPMNTEQKLKLFNLLVQIGFREIEVGAPAMSNSDYMFLRYLIEKKMIPAHVTIQVVTQPHSHYLDKTFAALESIDKAIVHIHNKAAPKIPVKLTSTQKTRQLETITATFQHLQSHLDRSDSNITIAYTPEGFANDDVQYAVEMTNAVSKILQPNPDKPLIVSLPTSAYLPTPNFYADQIEWFCRHVDNYADLIISLRCFNDKDFGIANATLGLLAGGQRVEGTLFGSGERAGFVDIATLALNLLSQGIDPMLDLNQLADVARIIHDCLDLPIPVRHPYVGEFAFTAFSNAQQELIEQGLAQYEQNPAVWRVPFLPIDPRDIGRSYSAMTRIKHRFGTQGLSYILAKHFGYQVPKLLLAEFSQFMQQHLKHRIDELTPENIETIFAEEYIGRHEPYRLTSINFTTDDERGDLLQCYGSLLYDETNYDIEGNGHGILDTMRNALQKQFGLDFIVEVYKQHALNIEQYTNAASYVRIITPDDSGYWGIGCDVDLTLSSVKALMSAVNRWRADV